jgi:hypothetical protein
LLYGIRQTQTLLTSPSFNLNLSFFAYFRRHALVSIRLLLLQGYDRGPGYYPQPGQTPSVPIGQIPQIVGRTYAFTEGTYGVMNEMSVGIGESTCSAIFTADAVSDGGAALLSGAALGSERGGVNHSANESQSLQQ